MGATDGSARLVEVLDLLGPVYRRISRAVEDDVAVDGATVGVRAVLDMLAKHGPLTVPQLGRAQSLSRQFVQRMVNDAARRRWVVAAENPEHKRSSLITLTAAGRRTIDTITRREAAALRTVAADLTGADIDGCLRVLRRMLTHLADVDVDEVP